MKVEELKVEPAEASSTATKADWFFVAWIVLTVAASAIFIGLSLAMAAASLATPLRSSRGKQITIWAFAIGMTLISLMPFLMNLAPVTIVTEYDVAP